MDNLDEDTLNVLLAEGVDLPTAIAASVRDEERPPTQPVRRVDRSTAGVAMLVGVLIALAVAILRML